MDIHTTHHQQIICNMYWGEGRLIEKEISAELNWQPLQETSANVWFDPTLFNHAMWRNYRPDKMQPLFFEVEYKNYLETLWLDEYDVKAYVRGWKNVPVFRVKKIQFDLQHIAEKSELTYKKIEAWFIIPGSLTSSKKDEKDAPQDTFEIPVLHKKMEVKDIFLDDTLDDCHVQVYDAALDDTPVTLVKLNENKSLQGNPPSAYSMGFKIVYDIIAGILSLLSQQHLQPVWQIMKQKGGLEDTCLELTYYNEDAPRRNNFPNKKLVNINFKLPILYKSVISQPLPVFMDYLDAVNPYLKILAMDDILDRFEKATELLNRLIGWRGSHTATWPQKLKTAMNDYQIYNQSRFIDEDIIADGNNCPKHWHNIKPSLHSLKVLVDGNSPGAAWFNGHKIKQRNEIVMQLLAELIIGKYLNLPDLLKGNL